MDWKAGIAKAVITPDTAVWLAGYGTKRAPEGKLHDLWVKALAIQDADGRRAALVTTEKDLARIPGPLLRESQPVPCALRIRPEIHAPGPLIEAVLSAARGEVR